ncbi:hypothetical protein ABE607_11980 [Comamonas aquatica]|jgi:hypothetical protein|uniref:Virulence factor n=1 Tax=Comamonas aquatica TaxID=225991 RepID=A0AA42W0X9_9BURK|nr:MULTISPECIES: hypothetical protein [Comamonas]MDE1556583.1 hypothetical protein [Comamonas aquatica]MDH0201240.1 hypothetical protein [Comamonas aquatica]MDH0371962.1 hypothetical protein [Comamonas aquatica]MDH0899238.1 hypothetical protein [Comamonas aquatica]MDH1429239.1 hypothetical protein [Comamonas aquatica]
MDRNLDTLRRHGRRWLAATGLLALAAAGSAHAGGNVGISVGIHVPGAPVYVMPPPPPPRAVYYAPPPPAVVYQAPPAYGYWAPPPPRGYGYYQPYRPYKHHKHYHRHHRHGDRD